MIIVGLTGTIGTGKSTVAKMFADMGAFIIDSDQIAHQVVEPGKPAWQAIKDYFGQDVLNEDQTLNRKRLANEVFNDPNKLQQLNSIVHPEIFKEDLRQVEEKRLIDPGGIVIKDIPLLLEVGPEVARKLVDIIIVVYCSPEIQLRRLIARGMSEEDAGNRIKNQIPVKEKMQFADFVINNDGSLEETRQQVQSIYSQLKRK
ncbi:MAG: dephospho-CoA kinase [Chloroflexi bacterium]|nr:dephospho-CoA kinase [Chloroflexota bacterium]